MAITFRMTSSSPESYTGMTRHGHSGRALCASAGIHKPSASHDLLRVMDSGTARFRERPGMTDGATRREKSARDAGASGTAFRGGLGFGFHVMLAGRRRYQ